MKKRMFALLMAQLLALGSVISPVYAAGTDLLETVDPATEINGSVRGDREQSLLETVDPATEINQVPEELTEESDENSIVDQPDENSAADAESGEPSGQNITEYGQSPDEVKEAPVGSELALIVEDALESQEEILLGRPAATDVTECGNEQDYAQALADMNRIYPCTYDGEIIIDLEEGTITDRNGEEVVGADYYVTTALREENAEEAAQLLGEHGYSNVSVEGGTIRADDRYDTGRIFVTSSEPVDTRGALSVVTFGESNLLQYASSAEAAIAAEMLKDDPGVLDVTPDYVIRVSYTEVPEDFAVMLEQTENSADMQSELSEEVSDEESTVGRYYDNEESYLSAAVSYMGIDRFLENTGPVNDPVIVAVLDSKIIRFPKMISEDRELIS